MRPRRLKELERENNEVKENAGRVAAEEPGIGGRMRKKAVKPGPSPKAVASGTGEEPGLFATGSLPDSAAGAFDVQEYRGRGPTPKKKNS